MGNLFGDSDSEEEEVAPKKVIKKRKVTESSEDMEEDMGCDMAAMFYVPEE